MKCATSRALSHAAATAALPRLVNLPRDTCSDARPLERPFDAPNLRDMSSLRHFVMKAEARRLYRDLLRALRGSDAATAAGVRAHARELYALHASETDLEQIRILLVDGRHSLDELKSSLGTVR